MKKYIGIAGIISLVTSMNANAIDWPWSDDEPKPITGARKAPVLNSAGAAPQMGIMSLTMPGDPMMMSDPMMPQPPAPPIDAYNAGNMPMPQTPPSYAGGYPQPPAVNPAYNNMYPPTPLPSSRRAPQFNQQALGMTDMPLAAPSEQVGSAEISARPLPASDSAVVPLPPAAPVAAAKAPVVQAGGAAPSTNVSSLRPIVVTKSSPLQMPDNSFPLPAPGSAPQAVVNAAPVPPANAVDGSGYPRLAAMPPAPQPPVPLAQDNRANELRQDLATAKKETFNAGGGNKIIVTKPMSPDMPPPAPGKATPSIPPMPPLARAEAAQYAASQAPVAPPAPYQPQFTPSQPPSQGLMPDGPTIVVRSSGASRSERAAPAPVALNNPPAEAIAAPPAPVAASPMPALLPPPSAPIAPIAQPRFAPAPVQTADSVTIPPMPRQAPPQVIPPAPAYVPQPPLEVARPASTLPPQPIAPIAASPQAPATQFSDLRPISGIPVASGGSTRYVNPALPESRYARLRAQARSSYKN